METAPLKSRKTLTTWNFAALFSFILILIIAAVPAAKRAWSGRTGDFTHLWQAAQAMLHGENIYASGSGSYIYPPLTAFIFQPLALLPERWAAVLWLTLNVVLTGAAAVIASREVARRWRSDAVQITWIIAAIATLLTVDKIRAIFVLGQIDCFMLLGFALILRWNERRPVAAGIAAGVAANFKYLTLIFIPYFLLKRNYRAAVAAAFSFALFLILPAVEVGLRRGLAYGGVALSGIGKLVGLNLADAPEKMTDIAWDRSVSITSALFRFSRVHGFSDAAAGFILLVLLIVVLGAILFISRRNGVSLFAVNRPAAAAASPMQTSLEWAVLVFAAVAFSPHTTTRQMVLVLLLFALGIAMLVSPAPIGIRIPLMAAMALLAAGLSFPPFGLGMNRAYWAWRAIGGPSWCALVLILTLVWAGSRTIADRAR